MAVTGQLLRLGLKALHRIGTETRQSAAFPATSAVTSLFRLSNIAVATEAMRRLFVHRLSSKNFFLQFFINTALCASSGNLRAWEDL
jgi:hypothetical protein